MRSHVKMTNIETKRRFISQDTSSASGHDLFTLRLIDVFGPFKYKRLFIYLMVLRVQILALAIFQYIIQAVGSLELDVHFYIKII